VVPTCLSKSSLLFDTLYHYITFLQCLHGYCIKRERPPEIFQHFSVHKYYCRVTGHSTGIHCLKRFTVMSAVFSDNTQWMFPELGLMLFSMPAGRIFIRPTLEHYNYHGEKKFSIEHCFTWHKNYHKWNRKVKNLVCSVYQFNHRTSILWDLKTSVANKSDRTLLGIQPFQFGAKI
jgi:hypothetical protein